MNNPLQNVCGDAEATVFSALFKNIPNVIFVLGLFNNNDAFNMLLLKLWPDIYSIRTWLV
jgi:hypothetical protein